MSSPKGLDLTGQRFGRLMALKLGPRSRPTKREPNGKRQWECLCDCGNTKLALQTNLQRGLTRSCGCLRSEVLRETKATHGHSRGKKLTRAYIIWRGMMQRCLNPKSTAYQRWYGAHGVNVCQQWHVFDNFLADMGEPPAGASLDRYPDPHGHYEPGNCRWATHREQCNNRRNNRVITINGKAQTLTLWCQELGIKRQTVQSRLSTGWDPVDALLTPVGSRNPARSRTNATGFSSSTMP